MFKKEFFLLNFVKQKIKETMTKDTMIARQKYKNETSTRAKMKMKSIDHAKFIGRR